MPSHDLKFATRLLAACLLAASAAPAHAYMGAGAGLSAIGSMLSFLAVFVLMAVGFVWYPLKRAIRKLRNKAPESDTQAQP